MLQIRTVRPKYDKGSGGVLIGHSFKCDFGSARRLNCGAAVDGSQPRFVGTAQYVSPEVCPHTFLT